MMELPDQYKCLDLDADMHNVIKHIEKFDDDSEAYHVCDIGDIIEKHNNWKLKLPSITPYYAVKCNDNIIMLELLAALGTGFDCASKNEIKKVLDLGVSPERILLGNPALAEHHFAYAGSVGVNLLVIDHETQLHKIKKVHPGAKLLLRIKAGASVSLRSFDEKFGCDPRNEALQLIEAAHSLGLEMVGVHFHVGACCTEYEAYRRSIAIAKNLYEYSIKLGCKFNILDIGGGFLGEKGVDISEMARVMNAALEEHFPDPTSVRVIAEPGRYYASSAFTLVTCIQLKKECTLDETRHIYYYVNDSVYRNFASIIRCTHNSVPNPKHLAQNNTTDELVPSTIIGLSCSAIDQIRENVLLPVMDARDYILFENMGAYTLSVSTNYPLLSPTKVHIFADRNIWMKVKDFLPLTKEHYSFTKISDDQYIGLNIVDEDKAGSH